MNSASKPSQPGDLCTINSYVVLKVSEGEILLKENIISNITYFKYCLDDSRTV